jgi:tryptophanyl-tRNA synthetase
MPAKPGVYVLSAEGSWSEANGSHQKNGDLTVKGVTTDRYAITFDERKKVELPVGFESKLYDGVGEKVTEAHYDKLAGYLGQPLSVGGKAFDSGRNLGALLEHMGDPTSFGIVSGRKPAGPCHFGHMLVVDTLAFFQKNGASIFMPMADLEASLDSKITNPRHYMYFTADNILDWGAVGLDLDGAHVYLQSEEQRVMNLGYKAARGLTFQMNVDIYGRDTILDEYQFLFASLTQVGDILLPQHPDFGRKHSVMISGADQDGNMSLTTALSRELLKRDKPEIHSVPSSLYVRTISNLKGDKESASAPDTTIYLGPSRNVYHVEDGRRTLMDIRKLNLPERLDDGAEKIMRFARTNPAEVAESIKRRAATLKGFAGVETTEDFIEATNAAVLAHKERRETVFRYAISRAIGDLAAESSAAGEGNVQQAALEKVWSAQRSAANAGVSVDIHQRAVRPSFWGTTNTDSHISYTKRTAQTPWYMHILRVADELVL